MLQPLQNFSTQPWMLADGGALDVDACPDCWERNAHLERYDLAARALGGMHLIDFGCGVGYGAEMLAAAGCVVVAVDLSAEALGLARKRRAGCASFVAPGSNLLNAPFGGVVAFEVIEHLDDPLSFMGWAAQRARHVLLSVPVVPTVTTNPYHRTDFTQESFRQLISSQFAIRSEWFQTMPLQATPAVMIVHAENLRPDLILESPE